MTVRVRPVSADRREFNVEMSRDIDNVAVHVKWPLTMGVAQGRYYSVLPRPFLQGAAPCPFLVTPCPF